MRLKNNTALITGASNGIGMEFAKLHASGGGNLVLVARTQEKLDHIKQELETKYNVRVYIITKDLSAPEAPLEVYQETRQQGIVIDYLINNAGFGDFGPFYTTDWEKEHRMINLNITALTHLTKLYLKDMTIRGYGKIMNIASTASFQPGPGMAVYFATKTYVLNFSEAVNHEVRRKGITVTALCPGPTESGFKEASALNNSKLFKKKQIPSAETVAKFGYKAMMKGKPVAIHGIKNYLLAQSVRFAPRTLATLIAGKMLEVQK